MKRGGLLILGLFIVLCILSYSTPTSAEGKYGVFNFQKVLTQCDQGKKNVEIMRKFETDRLKPIEEKEAELKKLREDLDKQKTKLAADALKQKEMDLQKKARDIQIMSKDLADEAKSKEQDMLSKLAPAIEKTIETIGQREKYALIVDSRYSIYHAQDVDLTQRIIDELNKTYKPGK
ncbi:MAG TPA: OmpH family outer membrane protein [Syntrophales bacterium]|nr:OmpH family outer membrane protein [Syntrophales bacterium]